MQVTSYWITNLSLNTLSFLFCTPSFVSLFLSTLKFPNIGLVKHSFIEAQYYFGLNSIEIEYELHYAHSLLAIPHHQLKDNSKFNVNFNLNMKYDYVRVKQKHLILISQHHWSPTVPHSPPLHPLLRPLAPPLLPHFSFFHPCFFGNLKNWKEVGDNMHRKHVVLRFGTEITSPHRGQQRLCTWQWTKIKTQWQLIWP